VTWQALQVRLQGSSHVSTNVPCQDYCLCESFLLFGSGPPVFLALLADGAGSTSDGGVGAKIACDTLRLAIRDWIDDRKGLNLLISRPLIEKWLAHSRKEISDHANALGKTLRDFACTFLGCVIIEERAVYFQIGDGAIVAFDKNTERYEPIFWPQNGEYANTTHFLSDSSYLDKVFIDSDRTAPGEIALFSDGLQQLLLTFSTKTAHQPFFHKTFSLLRYSRKSLTCLQSDLEKTFQNLIVTKRTDDDISLIIAKKKQD
jgi:Protein phosphatase 2C